MSYRLEQMLEPGERVIFRDRMGWRGILTRLLRFSPLLLGVCALGVALKDGDPEGLIYIFTPVIMVALLNRGSEVIVTESRILSREAWVGPRKVTAIDLADVGEVVTISEAVALRDRGGALVQLASVPKPEGLAAAIVSQTGVRAPKPPTGRVRSWTLAAAQFVVFIFLIMLMGGYVAADRYLSFMDVAWLPVYFVILGYFLAFVLAIWLAFFVGFILGMLLFALPMRFCLSSKEARAFFNPEEESILGAPRWLSSLFELPVIVAKHFASLLYGERL